MYLTNAASSAVGNFSDYAALQERFRGDSEVEHRPFVVAETKVQLTIKEILVVNWGQAQHRYCAESSPNAAPVNDATGQIHVHGHARTRQGGCRAPVQPSMSLLSSSAAERIRSDSTGLKFASEMLQEVLEKFGRQIVTAL